MEVLQIMAYGLIFGAILASLAPGFSLAYLRPHVFHRGTLIQPHLQIINPTLKIIHSRNQSTRQYLDGYLKNDSIVTTWGN